MFYYVTVIQVPKTNKEKQAFQEDKLWKIYNAITRL